MKQLCLTLLLVACGCGLNPRTTAPVYETPPSRAQAARVLNEALGRSGRGISQIDADTSRLAWHERRVLSDQRTIWVPRELALAAVSRVGRPERDGEGWRLNVEAAGGRVVFQFKDSVDAAKAEAAFTRLKQAD